MGQIANTGIFPSQPASNNALRPYSGPSGSKVQAVSVPSSVGTPSFPKTLCDSIFRVMISESRQNRLHIFCSSGSISPASAPKPTLNLFCAAAIPSPPIIMVVSAFANLLLNIDPSHATTPSFLRTSECKKGGNASGKCTCFASPKYPRVSSKFCDITLNSTFFGPKMLRTCRRISSTRTSEPVLRVPLYPAKSSFSLVPGFQASPAPSIHSNLLNSIRPLTQVSRSRSVMDADPAKSSRGGRGRGGERRQATRDT